MIYDDYIPIPPFGVVTIDGLSGDITLVAGANITITPSGQTITIAASSGSGGITSLNGLTGASQTFAVGSAGTDFGISSSGTVHTFNIPSASASNRGLVTTGTQTLAGSKTFSSAPTFSTFTLGSVPFIGTSGLLIQDNSNFFWDATNKRIGLGTASPSSTLTVKAQGGQGAPLQEWKNSSGIVLGYVDINGVMNFGATNPASSLTQLQIEGSLNDLFNLRVKNTLNGSNAAATILLQNDVSELCFFYMTSSGYTNNAFVGPQSASLFTNSQGGIAIDAEFGNIRIAVSEVEKMRLNSTGVGIGNSDPKTFLHGSISTILGVAVAQSDDANINAGEVNVWVDEAGNNLVFRVRYSDGTTLVTGTVPLA